MTRGDFINTRGVMRYEEEVKSIQAQMADGLNVKISKIFDEMNTAFGKHYCFRDGGMDKMNEYLKGMSHCICLCYAPVMKDGHSHAPVQADKPTAWLLYRVGDSQITNLAPIDESNYDEDELIEMPYMPGYSFNIPFNFDHFMTSNLHLPTFKPDSIAHHDYQIMLTRWLKVIGFELVETHNFKADHIYPLMKDYQHTYDIVANLWNCGYKFIHLNLSSYMGLCLPTGCYMTLLVYPEMVQVKWIGSKIYVNEKYRMLQDLLIVIGCLAETYDKVLVIDSFDQIDDELIDMGYIRLKSNMYDENLKQQASVLAQGGYFHHFKLLEQRVNLLPWEQDGDINMQELMKKLWEFNIWTDTSDEVAILEALDAKAYRI